MFDAMQTIHQLLETYGESHKNSTNKLIHWICVPSIMFSLAGLLMAIPNPFLAEKSFVLNWAFAFFFGLGFITCACPESCLLVFWSLVYSCFGEILKFLKPWKLEEIWL